MQHASQVQDKYRILVEKIRTADLNNPANTKAALDELLAVSKEQSQVITSNMASTSTVSPSAQPQQHKVDKSLLRDMKPQPFDRVRQGNELDTWIFMWENYFSVAGVEQDTEKVGMAGLNLKGYAAEWFMGICLQGGRPQTWIQLTEQMKQTFQPLSRSKVARDTLERRKQHDKESLNDYTNEMRRLFLAIPDMAEGEKLDRYIRGLHPQLRKDVYVLEPTSFEEAVKHAAKYDALRHGFRRYEGSFSHSNSNNSNSNNYGPGDMEIDTMRLNKPYHRSGYRGSNKHHGHHGHRSGYSKPYGKDGDKDKKKPRRCYICDSEEHLADRCPDKGKGHGRQAPHHRR